ncbi:sugar fermentation stimulation protein [Alphaproteobacteria bacterium]|nr:sugar fermentation stimulation protein [Alphaproteobacteria bacterium]
MDNSLKFEFENPLIDGIIKSRQNRFLMNVEIEGNVEKCHCPTTGKIGNVVFSDIPCLLSKSTNVNRKTQYTVEAISIDDAQSWIGINQTAINGYVNHFLKTGLLEDIAPMGETILREQALGSSRLDFRVGNVYVEVKMPLIHLFTKTESWEQKTPMSPGRFVKHVTELSNSLDKNKRAILLMCFVFDAPRFVPPVPSKYNVEITEIMRNAIAKGIELWQMNLSIDKLGIRPVA